MEIFIELSLLLVIAAVISGVMKILKQPLIMGYVLTGLIVGPLVLGFTDSTETMEIFSKFGVSILLFIVGLHLSPKVAREVGKVSVFAGIGQVFFTFLIMFCAASLLNYSYTEGLFIALALTFSSTIIVLKLLTDKKDIEKLYAKIAIGLLLFQDIVASFSLILVSASGENTSPAVLVGTLILKGAILLLIAGFVGMKILPKLGGFFASSTEYLFLFSMAWGLGVAVLFYKLGFSVEIGALVAGVALSVSPYSHEISAKLKPLRDFFLIMFFVFLGSKITFDTFQDNLGTLLIFTGLVLFIKPLIILSLLGLLGYNKKTSFLSSASLAQTSEFSLILALLAVENGRMQESTLSMLTIVTIVSIAVSTYFIKYSEKIYPKLIPILRYFETPRAAEEIITIHNYEVILFGCNRIGYSFLKLFKKLGQSLLVVDFNPEIIKQLKESGVDVRYGDAEDEEFLQELNVGDSKMVVSTIPDFETNSFLVKKIKSLGTETGVIVISHDVQDALKLYEMGATYVIMPHFIGGHFAALLAAKHWLNLDRFEAERAKQIKMLNERIELGHHLDINKLTHT